MLLIAVVSVDEDGNVVSMGATDVQSITYLSFLHIRQCRLVHAPEGMGTPYLIL